MDIIIFIVFTFFLIGVLTPSKTEKRTKKEECPPHKWIYKNEETSEEYMVCSKCKSMPGSLMKEEGP